MAAQGVAPIGLMTMLLCFSTFPSCARDPLQDLDTIFIATNVAKQDETKPRRKSLNPARSLVSALCANDLLGWLAYACVSCFPEGSVSIVRSTGAHCDCKVCFTYVSRTARACNKRSTVLTIACAVRFHQLGS